MNETYPTIDVEITQVSAPDRFLAVKAKRDRDELYWIERELLKDFHNYSEPEDNLKIINKNDLVSYYSTEEEKCYRGLIETVFIRSHGTTHRLFLVDHGKQIMTKRNSVRPLPSRFADVPFGSCYLFLPGLRPVHIGLELTDDITARFCPSPMWDESAITFVKCLVHTNKYKARAEILRPLSHLKFHARLHFGEGSDSRCLNEMLILGNFAILDVPDLNSVPETKSNDSELSDVAEAIASKLPLGRGKPTGNLDDVSATKPPPPVTDNLTKFLHALGRGNKNISGPGPGPGPGNINQTTRRASSETDANVHSDSSLSELSLPKFKATSTGFSGKVISGDEKSAQSSPRSIAEINAGLARFTAAVTATSRKINKSSENASSSHTNLDTPSQTYPKSDFRSQYQKKEFPEKKTNEQPEQQSLNRSHTSSAIMDKENSRLPASLTKWNAYPGTRSESRTDSDADLIFTFGQFAPASRWTSLQNSNIHKSLRSAMTAQNIMNPYSIQTYSWPAVARLLDTVLIGTQKSGKSVGYLVPLLSSLLHSGTYSTLPVGNGPIVLIICASCNSAFNVFNRCRLLLSDVRTVKPLMLQSLPLTEGQKVELLNGCEILVTLPEVLKKAMSIANADLQTVNFNRLCHLVIDDANNVMSNTEIVHHVTTTYKRASSKLRDTPRQIILCGEQWTEEVAKFANACMSDPVIYMSCLLEACVFTNMKLYPTVCLPELKDGQLLNILPRLPCGRIVIFTSSKESVVHVAHLLESCSYFVHMAHTEMQLSELTSVKRNWVCQSSNNTQLIFVLSDDVYSDVTIRNARVLVHYEYSENKMKFRQRFGVLTKQLANDVSLHEGGLSQKITTNCSSYLIVTDENDVQAGYFYNFLKRFKGLSIPRQLKEIADKHSKSKANPKIALCTIWKAFGQCKKITAGCKGRRHVLVAEHDMPDRPVDGKIELTITFVVSANHFYGKLKKLTSSLESKEFSDQCKEIAMKMQFYYATPANSIAVESVHEGLIGAIRSDDGIHYRARVTELIDTSYCKILYIDTGRIETVQIDRVLKLPSVLEMYQAQVVEIILSCIQPADGSTEWLPSTSRFVSESILDQRMIGKIALTIGQTFWVEKLVKIKYLSTIHCTLKDFDVIEELTKKQLAVSNPDHLKKIVTANTPVILESGSQWSGKSLIDSVHKLSNPVPQQQESGQKEAELATSTAVLPKIIREENSETESTGENPLMAADRQSSNDDSSSVCSNSRRLNEEIVDDTASVQSSTIEMTPEKKVERDDACSADVCGNEHKEENIVDTIVAAKPVEPARKLTLWETFSKMRKITKPSVAELKANTSYDVYVSNVVSPGLFYAQRSDLCNRLDELTQKIKESELRRVSGPIDLDKFYLAQFASDDEYFRVKVKEIKLTGEVVVFSVDFGDERTVLKEDLRVLDNEFLDCLPLQAISCRLSNVFPMFDNEWSDEAIEFLWKMVVNDDDDYVWLTIHVDNVISTNSNTDPRYEVTLMHQNRSLGDRLVEAGLAVKNDGLPVTLGNDATVDDHQKRRTKKNSRAVSDLKNSNDSSTAAKIVWYETDTDVVLKVMLASLKTYNLKVELKHVHFSCLLGDRYYSNDLDLYSSVNYEYYEKTVTPKYLLIQLKKANYGKWSYLLKDKTRVPWLTFDLDHIDVSDESDYEPANSFATLPSSTSRKYGKPFATNYRVQNVDSETSPSESEDDDFMGDAI